MQFSTIFFIVASSVVAQNNINDQCASICKSLGANSANDMRDCSTECLDVVGKLANQGQSSMGMSASSSVSGTDMAIVATSSSMNNMAMTSMASMASMSSMSSMAVNSGVNSNSKASMSSVTPAASATAKPATSGNASKSAGGSASKSKGSKSGDSSNASTHVASFAAFAAALALNMI